MKEVLFIVHHPETGKTYTIYSNGDTEGFPTGSCIVNRYRYVERMDYSREVMAAQLFGYNQGFDAASKLMQAKPKRSWIWSVWPFSWFANA